MKRSPNGQALAVDAFNAVGCTGWSRVDSGDLRESDNEPFPLEINTTGYDQPFAGADVGPRWLD